jgi:hypothetical protein
MSLGEWLIVSLLLIKEFGFGWEYVLSMLGLLVVILALKTLGVIDNV